MARATSNQPRPGSIEALILKSVREQLPPGWTAEGLSEKQAQRLLEKVRDNHRTPTSSRAAARRVGGDDVD